MRKILVILIVIGLVTLVSAAAVLTTASFTVPAKDAPERQEGVITFLVDGQPAECYINEPNLDIDDEFEECVKSNADYSGKRITNVEDWTGRTYQQVTTDLGRTFRSFDQDKLNAYYDADAYTAANESFGGELDA